MNVRLVDLEAECHYETNSARLFDFGGPEKVWLPKAQHEWDEADKTVTLPEWLAVEKGLV